jgi:nucleoside-diphosphate-sugar epimerase
VARVGLLCPDLLFGSKLSSALTAAGHEVVGADEPADALVVDLTDDVEKRLRAAAGADVPTLAFYAHVEQDVRRRAEVAGIDRVVPRSRMAREAPQLLEALLR